MGARGSAGKLPIQNLPPVARERDIRINRKCGRNVVVTSACRDWQVNATEDKS